MEDLSERLKEQLEYQAIRGEKWDPKPGDSLLGKVIKRDKIPTSRKDKAGNVIESDMVVIEDAAGKRWTVWEKTALNKFFEDVKVGNQVGLMFVGEKATKKGLNPFKNIEYVIVKPAV